ncbi:hypothetical protein [Streptomyces litchfieldiae]|uniref:DUF768 domain-containing protein n=1 Tax=Streptomyces litchfieldiae TaxID=3075543 RepID=A0ABU2N0T5_9ACTN|nr:hypothetical protein [Streptomyces sp. DSM 44938]MDT0346688.1 hypothetical protein [Streptomyces sp. DSM 44938]
MEDFIDTWTGKLVEAAGGGLDEDAARALVTEIFNAATLREVNTYEEEIKLREAEREE